MKTKEILNLDFRIKENKEKIQKVLKQIKPLSKCQERQVPIEMLEKLIFSIIKKYDLRASNMQMSFFSSDTCLYTICVFTDSTGEMISLIHGMCLYEVYAKLAIFLYSQVKSDCRLRGMTKEEFEREKIAKSVESRWSH
ncbi:MAG: hypothetical protein J6R68_06510 [Clostridia bacterium]|nr:hypothetical protein [Clostridia bacterium]